MALVVLQGVKYNDFRLGLALSLQKQPRNAQPRCLAVVSVVSELECIAVCYSISTYLFPVLFR